MPPTPGIGIPMAMIAAVAISIGFLASSSVQAQTLLFDNFESYNPVPTPINGKNPGDGNSNNWSFVPGDTPPTTVATSEVIAGSSTGGSGANVQVLNFTADSGTAPVLSRSFTLQNSQVVELNFKIKLNSGGGTWNVDLRQGSSPAFLFRVNPAAQTLGVLGKATEAGGGY